MKCVCSLFVVIGLILAGSAVAAEPELGAVALEQALRDAGTDLRLMCVAAHPDDEDSGTLTLYRKKHGFHTIALIATRGEGGQNEAGPELYEELGVIRTWEMMAASDITGADLRFLSLPEFGYSKSREETYAIWGEEEALRRTVHMIRLTKPDVIITHHGPSGGHGHHQAIGHALQKAFDVAADPDVFPEQIRAGLEPWQPARLYLRSGGAGSIGIPMDELDAVRGLTYNEISAKALSEHISQGFDKFVASGFFRRRSPSYALVKSVDQVVNPGTIAAPDAGLMAGLRDRVPESDRRLSQMEREPAAILDRVSALLPGAYAERDTSPQAYRRWRRLNRLAAVAAKLRLQAFPEDETVVPGQEVPVELRVDDFAGAATLKEVAVTGSGFPGFEKVSNSNVTLAGSAETKLTVTIPNPAPYSIPHPEYVYEDRFLRPQMTVVARVDLNGVPVELHEPIYVDVAPPVEVGFLDAPYLAREGVDGAVTLKLALRNHRPSATEGAVRLAGDKRLRVDNATIEETFNAEGEERIVPVRVQLPSDAQPGDYEMTASLAGFDESEDTAVRVVDLQIPENVRVGVIQSYDDTFMKTLERFNVPHKAVTKESFTPENLDQFTTIIVDIRAYLVRPDLIANNGAVLDYVKRGGNLLVMYHKTFEWSEDFAPYPITLSRNRVTVEEAPIELLEPDHPLFNIPNKINGADWDGWIQERGLYFPSRWDDAYTPLVAVSDPGESIPPGSVLIAEYGQGTYLYTALGWYRQLRELHPGALRVFANMLAL